MKFRLVLSKDTPPVRVHANDGKVHFCRGWPPDTTQSWPASVQLEG